MGKKVVIALGGNALGKNLKEQRIAVKETAKVIVDLVEDGCNVVVTHGNGPQVGMINNAMDYYKKQNTQQGTIPLSVSVAMSQSYIGSDLQRAIRRELLDRNILNIPVTTIVTHVVVDADDSAFQNPTKPIGNFMTLEEANKARVEHNWTVCEDAGRGYRRVVASPTPKKIIEIDSIKELINNQIVIACGGGGIPVIESGSQLDDVDAVIDKDLTSSLLAKKIDADIFIILTAVEKVAIFYGKENEKWLSLMTCTEAKKYCQEGHFAPGSMLPKVQAGISFAQSRMGREAIITLLEKAREGLRRETGTRIII